MPGGERGKELTSQERVIQLPQKLAQKPLSICRFLKEVDI